MPVVRPAKHRRGNQRRLRFACWLRSRVRELQCDFDTLKIVGTFAERSPLLVAGVPCSRTAIREARKEKVVGARAPTAECARPPSLRQARSISHPAVLFGGADAFRMRVSSDLRSDKTMVLYETNGVRLQF